MSPRKSVQTRAQGLREVQRRFSHLIKVMKDRYLDAGYELDDVHLAEILGVHDGVLRKGKSSSVSPALVRAVGDIWNVDLNWLLLGEGQEPEKTGPPLGVEKISREMRVSRGRWDEHKVRRLLAERKLSQRHLANLLATDPQRAGNLVRGTLRDPELRVKLAGILEVDPESLFLVSRSAAEGRSRAQGALRQADRQLFTSGAVRRALESMLNRQLEDALALQSGQPAAASGFEPTVVRLDIPPAPAELSESERLRYDHNREVLERWSRTQNAFEVPPEVAQRYCREVVGYYDGGRVDDVGGILRDFLQENQETGDSKSAGTVALKSSVLVIGNTEIPVDDPELLARLPEYLNSAVGRKRLLDWLRKNVKPR